MRLKAGEWLVLGGSGLIAAFALLVGVMIYLRPPPVEYEYVETAAAQQGEAIYHREGCGSCHKIFGNGATYGPRLDGVGSRRTAEWLQAYLRDPRPDVGDKPYRLKMPSYKGLKPVELDALVAYLQALRTRSADGGRMAAPEKESRARLGLISLVLVVEAGADARPRNDRERNDTAQTEDEQRHFGRNG